MNARRPSPWRVRRSVLVAAAVAAAFALALAVWIFTPSPRTPIAGAAFIRESKAAGAVRVLFIGNSFTYGGDVPGDFAWSMEHGSAMPLTVAVVAAGGFTLAQHWRGGKARAALDEGPPWSYVVLQEASNGAFANLASMQLYVTEFDREIKKAGARTVLYMTWADLADPARQETIARAYEDLARRTGALLAPVGRAWAAAGDLRPRLFDADGHHASPLGAYLAACVIYTTITGAPTDGLEAPPAVSAAASALDIARLQRLASDAAR